MSQASITITDDEATGQTTVVADFGDKLDEQSQAHNLITVLLESVLTKCKSYSLLEDTTGNPPAGESAEPSRIILPE